MMKHHDGQDSTCRCVIKHSHGHESACYILAEGYRKKRPSRWQKTVGRKMISFLDPGKTFFFYQELEN
jgi:hypothetical protein